MSDFREDFKKAVNSATKSTDEEKERIWRRIDAEIKVNEMRKRRNAAGWMAASIVFAVLVVFTAFTPTGRAAVSRIIALFAAEKTVVTTVEGEEEEAEQGLYVDAEKKDEQVAVSEAPEETGSEELKPVRYVLYIDEERYTMQKGENEDTISPKDYPEDYPPVEMRISQIQDRAVERMTDEVFTQLKGTYDNVYEAEPFSFSHVSGLKLVAFNGDLNGDKETMPQWDDEVMNVYIFDNTQGGVFVIRVRYFIEAEEGHGARLEQMLDQLELIPAQ
ncbi:MAG: hypothetical protein AB1Z19_03325 [Eubacteriales bacterium]